MKKIFVLVLLLVAILLVSCNPETPSESIPTESTPTESTPNESTDGTTSHVHDFSGKLQYDETGHWSTCECGEVSRSEHIMEDVEVTKVATCIEEGTKNTKCKDCGYSEIVTIAKLEHTHEKHETVAATCIKEGVTAYEHCSICGINIGKETLPKISHDYKDEFCTMCGSHEPSEYMRFVQNGAGRWLVCLNFGAYGDHTDLPSRYDLPITELYIPSYTDTGEKVEGVDDFMALKQLKKVIIPEGINIETLAFYDCSNLEEVVVLGDKSSVIRISQEAFYGCSELKKLELPEKCYLYGDGVFTLCKKLKSLDTLIIGDGYGDTFKGCTSLQKVSVDTDARILFKDCYALKEVYLGPHTLVLCHEKFSGCSSLESIVIPDSVYRIESNVFYGCEKLKNIVLPKELKHIYNFAFAACTSLENITIPKSISRLEDRIFDGCLSLKEINYEGTVEDWNNIHDFGKVFDGSSVERIICSDGVIEL